MGGGQKPGTKDKEHQEEGWEGGGRTVWDVLYKQQKLAAQQQRMTAKLVGVICGEKEPMKKKRKLSRPTAKAQSSASDTSGTSSNSSDE
jgi:hypothetical protein